MMVVYLICYETYAAMGKIILKLSTMCTHRDKYEKNYSRTPRFTVLAFGLSLESRSSSLGLKSVFPRYM